MRQLQIAGFLLALFVNLVIAATAYSSERLHPALECESGGLLVEANKNNSATKEDLVELHHSLLSVRENFDVYIEPSEKPVVAYLVYQYDYDGSAQAKKQWRKLQRNLTAIHSVELSCAPEQQEQEEGGVTTGD